MVPASTPVLSLPKTKIAANVKATKLVLRSFPRWQICHVSRDANKAAHGLPRASPMYFEILDETLKLGFIFLIFKK
jgi:hypothetical protein